MRRKHARFRQRTGRRPRKTRRRLPRLFRDIATLAFAICIVAALDTLAPDKEGTASAWSVATPVTAAANADIRCTNPYVIDGDTLDCAGVRIRLAHIDAPEMPGHCREGRRCTPGNPYQSRDYLQTLTRNEVICHPLEQDHYGRTVAFCDAGKRDVSCAMVESGHAVRRYGSLNCT